VFADTLVAISGLFFTAILAVVLALSSRISLGLRVFALLVLVCVNGAAIWWHFLLSETERRDYAEQVAEAIGDKPKVEMDWPSVATRCGRLVQDYVPELQGDFTRFTAQRSGTADDWRIWWRVRRVAENGSREETSIGCTGRALAIRTVNGIDVETAGMSPGAPGTTGSLRN
jgi:hypothetical protein